VLWPAAQSFASVVRPMNFSDVSTPPTGPLLSRLIGRSQNQWLFSGHPSGLPCLVASCGVCDGGAHILDKPWASVVGSRSGPDSVPGTPHHLSQDVAWGRLCAPTVLVGVLLQCQPNVTVFDPLPLALTVNMSWPYLLSGGRVTVGGIQSAIPSHQSPKFS